MPTFEFLSQTEEVEVINAIEKAESLTSGEIRVHIEKHTDLTCLERAKEIFCQLKMHETELKNGVLFYVGVEDHTFAILGDSGIDAVVEPDFWECTKDLVLENFKKGNFKQGLIDGILRAGERLQTYFPKTDCNPNELSNEISRN
jgi:uncharacterized membrane protein